MRPHILFLHLFELASGLRAGMLDKGVIRCRCEKETATSSPRRAFAEFLKSAKVGSTKLTEIERYVEHICYQPTSLTTGGTSELSSRRNGAVNYALEDVARAILGLQ